MIFPQTNKIEYIERKYRNLIEEKDLISFQIKEEESDLFIRTNQELSSYARQMVLNFRKQIENYIYNHPLFKSTLLPYSQDKMASEIIQSMIHTTALCGVGPMASVAGAIAEFGGKKLLNYSSEVIVENGGDIFIKSNQERKVNIFAGESPLSQKIILKVETPINYIG